MNGPLDEQYFIWLYRQVGDPDIKNPNLTYFRTFKQLYDKEFVWFVPNDDNRIADGKDLRYEFVNESELQDVDLGWMGLGCSMLEMLIGLSRRLAFEADGKPRDWFWHMMRNVGLIDYNDNYPDGEKDVDAILDRVIWRTYRGDGRGGLFPLRTAKEDQRKVELWYQLSAYVLDLEDEAA